MSRTGKLVIVGVVVLVLALGGGYLLFASRTSDSPPPAALDPAPTTTAGQATEDTQADGAATPDGSWQVSDDGSSYVGYRVRGQLGLLSGPNEAVGRTTAVTGTMEVAGDTVESVKIEAEPDPADQRREPPGQRHPHARPGVGAVPDGHPGAGRAAPARRRAHPGPGGPRRGHGRLHRPRGHPRRRARPRGRLVRVDHPGRRPAPSQDGRYQIEPPYFGPVVSIEGLAVDLKLVFERAWRSRQAGGR